MSDNGMVTRQDINWIKKQIGEMRAMLATLIQGEKDQERRIGVVEESSRAQERHCTHVCAARLSELEKGQALSGLKWKMTAAVIGAVTGGGVALIFKLAAAAAGG